MIFDVRLRPGFVPLSVRGIEDLSDRLLLFHESLDPWWLEFEKRTITSNTTHRLGRGPIMLISISTYSRPKHAGNHKHPSELERGLDLLISVLAAIDSAQ